MDGGTAFVELRDRLLRDGLSHEQALESFDWPPIRHFNWAIDYFDRVAAGNDRPALRVVDDKGSDEALSFAELAGRSNQVANFLAAQGVGPGDRVLIMLGNVAALWEAMLATMKLGAVMIPATTLLKRGDIQDRLERGRVRAVIADRAQAVQFDGLAGAPIRISVGGSEPGWRAFEEPEASDRALVPGPDPLRLAVPKAFVVLVAGAAADAATARSILEHVRGTRLALPAHSAPRIYGLAEDHFREDPPRRAAPCRTGSAGRRSAPDLRVLGA